MVRTVAWMLALLTISFLAGCSGTEGDGDGATSSSSASSSGPAADPCPTVAAGSSLDGWQAYGGAWGEVDSLAGHKDVVCGKADGAVQSLVDTSGTYSSLEANVTFAMLAGDSGAGLVINFADDQNFVIVRYSPREQGWHLFTMVDGNRQKQDNASVPPPTTNPEPNEWVKLRVVSQDGVVRAYDGSTKVIDYNLTAEASHQGRVGYFVRDAGMAAAFDDFSVRAL